MECDVRESANMRGVVHHEIEAKREVLSNEIQS
jgi:hypothetical protein